MFIKGTLIYLFLISILAILFVYSKSFLLFVAALLLIIFVLTKVDYKLGLLMCVIFVFFIFYKINTKMPVETAYLDEHFKVIEVKEKYIIAIKDNIRYLIYIEPEQAFYKNDIINVIGEVKIIEKDLDIDVFEFSDYLKNKRVFYLLDAEKIELIESNKTLSQRMVDFCCSKLTDDSYYMSRMLLFNDKRVDVDSYENLKKINAIHLFVVSGFHISFLYSVVEKICRKKAKLSVVLGILICLLYVFILDFSISSTRALFSLILIKLFNKWVNSLDALSLSGIILLFIEPLNIYSYSFIMSFLVSFVIIISKSIYGKYNKIVQGIIVSLISFFAMIPIQLLLNYEINIISLISNFILSYVVTVIFILCLIGLPLSIINSNLFGFVYKAFNNTIDFLSNLNTSILFGSIPIFVILIYYLLFFINLYVLENKKKKLLPISFSSIITLLLCIYFKNYLNPFQTVTFLNVYQGDCIIIQDSFSEKVMLIDTGGQLKYDIANKKIIPYLRYHGIDSIDIVVITHDDYDHNGALESLKISYKIDRVIDDNNIENIILGKITLANINIINSESVDKHDGSIVLYGNIGGFNYLFTGDISKEIEKQLIYNYSYLDVDVLKVAHHGSNTSTSDEFVSFINPTYAIISVGKNNLYKHPHKQVLETLKNNKVIVYRTDINGTIRFKMKNHNLYFIDSAK